MKGWAFIQKKSTFPEQAEKLDLLPASFLFSFFSPLYPMNIYFSHFNQPTRVDIDFKPFCDKIKEYRQGDVSMASLYNQTKQNPPKINIPENSKEVILELVSVMCDNKYRFKFKKIDGEFKLSTGIQAYSNFQIPNADRTDLEWLADDNKWDEIINHINAGVQRIYGAKSR